MQTFTFQRSSKALSVHVDGCNISVSSAVLRGVRPKPKHHATMERAAAAPRIKRRHISPRVDRQRSVPKPSLVGVRFTEASCDWSNRFLKRGLIAEHVSASRQLPQGQT